MMNNVGIYGGFNGTETALEEEIGKTMKQFSTVTLIMMMKPLETPKMHTMYFSMTAGKEKTALLFLTDSPSLAEMQMEQNIRYGRRWNVQ